MSDRISHYGMMTLAVACILWGYVDCMITLIQVV